MPQGNGVTGRGAEGCFADDRALAIDRSLGTIKSIQPNLILGFTSNLQIISSRYKEFVLNSRAFTFHWLPVKTTYTESIRSDTLNMAIWFASFGNIDRHPCLIHIKVVLSEAVQTLPINNSRNAAAWTQVDAY